jgi:HEAT repeat protein
LSAVLAVTVEDGVDLALDVLAGSLADGDPSVRSMAAMSLALLGWDAASGKLTAPDELMQPALVAMSSKETAVRRAATALVLLLRPEGVEFRKAFPRAEDDLVLWEAANERLFIIGLGGGSGFRRVRIDALLAKLDVLEKDPRPKPSDRHWERIEAECRGALFELREFGGQRLAASAPRLSTLLEQDFGSLRIDLARTLLEADPERTAEAVAAAASVLTAPDAGDSAGSEEERLMRRGMAVRGRMDALDLLAELGPAAKPAIPALITVLAWKEDPETEGDDDLAARSARLGSLFWHARRAKRTAADALGAFGPDAAAAKEALRALFSHEDLRVRYRAARALRRIGP